ncbi:MAG: hypothetical protein DELT_00107 [Desulfovibrio sp.]
MSSISGITSSTTQGIWEEIRQETMRNTEKTTVTASNGQEVSVVQIDPDDLDGDGVVTMMEREKVAKRTRSTTSSASATGIASSSVSTELENVGPNTYERIRTNAGKTYLSQAMAGTPTGEEPETSFQGLNTSA